MGLASRTQSGFPEEVTFGREKERAPRTALSEERASMREGQVVFSEPQTLMESAHALCGPRREQLGTHGVGAGLASE